MADHRKRYGDQYDNEFARQGQSLVTIAPDPFSLKLWPLDTKPLVLMNQIRAIQTVAGQFDINPASLKLVTVTTAVDNVVPEEDSNMLLEMRKLALEKLTDSDKDLLKVRHWDVYHKLGDRTNIDDDDDDYDERV